MKMHKNHPTVGKNLIEVRGLDIGSYYPVINDVDNKIIVGVFSAEFGTPDGYILDESLQAFVPASEELLEDY